MNRLFKLFANFKYMINYYEVHINDKEKIVEFLINMKDQPTTEVVKRINKIAIENEDYETCEALKEYSNLKDINLN